MIDTSQTPWRALGWPGSQGADMPLGRTALTLGLALAALEAALAALVIALGLAREGIHPGSLVIVTAAAFGAALVLLIQSLRGYAWPRLRRPEQVLPQLLALATLLVAAGMSIIGAIAARRVLDVYDVLLTACLFCLLLAAVRVLLALGLQRAEARGALRRRIAVLDLLPVGVGLDRPRLQQLLEAEHGCRCALDLVAPAADFPGQSREAESAGDAALEAWVADCVETVRWAEAITVVALPTTEPARLGRLLEALEVVPVRVGIAVPLARSPVGFAVTRVHEEPLDTADRAIKRLTDIVVALAMLVFLGPLLLLVALAVKLDSPGPVFFRQVRRGYNNRRFDALKFRSLRHEMADPLADRLVTRDDPRVTRVGAFLRRSSLDELPQLINVLVGDMSLVGPRPHPLNAKAGGRPYEEVVERFQRRYRVRPGITGWAQVNGLRGNTETEDHLLRRVDFDLDYIRSWSLWLDLLILLKTPWATLKGENAH
jgi:exopolysaccharide biosynthesis polyprenyl glycosylphosphotransferase